MRIHVHVLCIAEIVMRNMYNRCMYLECFEPIHLLFWQIFATKRLLLLLLLLSLYFVWRVHSTPHLFPLLLMQQKHKYAIGYCTRTNFIWAPVKYAKCKSTNMQNDDVDHFFQHVSASKFSFVCQNRCNENWLTMYGACVPRNLMWTVPFRIGSVKIGIRAASWNAIITIEILTCTMLYTSGKILCVTSTNWVDAIFGLFYGDPNSGNSKNRAKTHSEF